MSEALANAPRASATSFRRTGKRRLIPLIAGVFALLFGWFVAQFYDPATGLTSMLSIGDRTEAVAINQLRDVPHHTYRHSYGYDGSYYVQIALSPLLNDPELTTAIDNLPYRARRILLSWTAWGFGFGHPTWIVWVFPFLNVATWFALAWLLTRWFPLTSWDALFRWATFMFSHGLCMSVRHSLVDAPSLLLIVLAVIALERRRPLGAAAAFALATLTRETSVLASIAFREGDPRQLSTWLKRLGFLLLVALPLGGWLLYLRLKFGPAASAGFNNFAPPLVGLAEKWVESTTALFAEVVWAREWFTLACVLSLTVQCVFLLARWRPGHAWWRIGITFAVMALFLSRPVWEGSPGAATRVLLPMSLAFNILVPHGRRWLPILVAGNLTFFASLAEFTPPARFYTLSRPAALAETVSFTDIGDWYGVEGRRSHTWRWASGPAGLRIENASGTPLRVTLHGNVSALDRPRDFAIEAAGQTLWSVRLDGQRATFDVVCIAPPGSTDLLFTTPQPPPPEDRDLRRLAFSVSDLKIAITPVTDPAP